jgi:glycosyltransferase involved in cell wall biosynthesis
MAEVAIVPAPGPRAARAEALEALLTAAGLSVTVDSIPRGRPDAVLTVGAQEAGRMMRLRGIPWILDVGVDWATAAGVAREATLLTTENAEARASINQAVQPVSMTLDGEAAAGALAEQVRALVARRDVPQGPRVLLLGPVNSQHVEHLALALRPHCEVVVAGEVWPGGPTELPAAGIPVERSRGRFVPWLRTLVKASRPTVVHAHWMPFAAKALAANARPLIAQPWGSDVYRATRAFRVANLPVARFADRVVADSQHLLDAMVGLGARPERTMLFNWGVDLETFAPGEPPDAPVILHPRSLTELYNPQVLLDAFRVVRGRVPDARLVLKHMGEDPPPVTVPEGAMVVGRVPYDEMPGYYRSAAVCVSIPDSDSSPRSVWEAMACGCPCVVSDLPWARELLVDGTHALLVAPRVPEVAAALERVLTDHELAARLRREGRALVERTRDARRETARLVDLYRDLS